MCNYVPKQIIYMGINAYTAILTVAYWQFFSYSVVNTVCMNFKFKKKAEGHVPTYLFDLIRVYCVYPLSTLLDNSNLDVKIVSQINGDRNLNLK